MENEQADAGRECQTRLARDQTLRRERGQGYINFPVIIIEEGNSLLRPNRRGGRVCSGASPQQNIINNASGAKGGGVTPHAAIV